MTASAAEEAMSLTIQPNPDGSLTIARGSTSVVYGDAYASSWALLSAEWAAA
jgi:hypothetical protein